MSPATPVSRFSGYLLLTARGVDELNQRKRSIALAGRGSVKALVLYPLQRRAASMRVVCLAESLPEAVLRRIVCSLLDDRVIAALRDAVRQPALLMPGEPLVAHSRAGMLDFLNMTSTCRYVASILKVHTSLLFAGHVMPQPNWSIRREPSWRAIDARRSQAASSGSRAPGAVPAVIPGERSRRRRGGGAAAAAARGRRAVVLGERRRRRSRGGR